MPPEKGAFFAWYYLVFRNLDRLSKTPLQCFAVKTKIIRKFVTWITK